MNIILFTADELEQGVPVDDPRVTHALQIIGVEEGSDFDAGIVDGPRVKARVRISGGRATFQYTIDSEEADLYSVTLIVGMPRPQTARRILREATALGVAKIVFCQTDRSQTGYGQSRLWSTGEFERHLVDGAQQAFSTRIPEVSRHESLGDALDDVAGGSHIALDNYEATSRLTAVSLADGPVTLAFGAERGWSAAERHILRDRNFVLCSLGERVLRLETAIVAATTITLTKIDIL